jgi:AcrR family transcriptional regulator
MTRRKVELRREEILTGTIAQIESSGMSSLRVGDVAQALGVSSGLIFYHFATKDALLVQALEYAVVSDAEQLDKALGTPGDPVERLREVLGQYGPTGPAHGWTLWVDAWSMALRNAAIRRSLRKLDERWRDALKQVIDEGVASGHFTCADPSGAVTRIGALLDGLSVAALVYETVSRQELQTWVRNATADEVGIGRHRLTAC